MAEILSRNPDLLAEYLLRHQTGMSDPSDDKPWVMGLATFLAFLIFGLIPLIPYFLMPPGAETFQASVAATFTALALLGLLRWHVTRQGVWRSVGETVLIGGVCAVIAFLVGLAFR